MATGTFATAINCIDGRVQHAVYDWVKIHTHVDYVDMVTEPGPDKELTQGSAALIEALKQKVLISVNEHGSRTIAVAGHHGCAGNPVSDEQHQEEIRQSVAVIKSWGLPVHVYGLWVNSWWQVELLCKTE
jgi:carbonic anhydrase